MTSRCEFDLAALRRDYGDIPGEARACRSAAALFDFSFMVSDAEFPPGPGAIVVTSACRSVVAGGVLGLGYVRLARRSGEVVDPTGQFHRIREVGLPFFDPTKRRPRGEWHVDLTPDIAP
jgi:glycine cleavage system aminomethyltransferase T